MHAKINQALLVSTPSGPRDAIIVDEIFRYRASNGRQRRLVLGRFLGIGAAEARQRAVAASGDLARGIDLLDRKRQTRKDQVRAAQSTLKAFLGWIAPSMN